MTEHSFHGIHSLPERGKSVTYVSGTICYLCLRSLIDPFQLANTLNLLHRRSTPVRTPQGYNVAISQA
jgi:hypothetical protein